MVNFLTRIRQAFLSLVGGDLSAYPKSQATYHGKAVDFIRLSPYGLDSNPPKNSFVLLLSSGKKETVKYGFISDFLNRKKGLAEGEIILYNTVTKSYVFVKEDGSIELLNADTSDYIHMKANGDIDIQTSTLNLNGDLSVTGNINCSGTVTASVDVVGGGVSLKNHVHSGVTSGASNTGPPV